MQYEEDGITTLYHLATNLYYSLQKNASRIYRLVPGISVDFKTNTDGAFPVPYTDEKGTGIYAPGSHPKPSTIPGSDPGMSRVLGPD